MKRSQFVGQIKEMSRAELEQRLAEAKEELFNLRFKRATGNLDNPARIGIVRKNVARIMTMLGRCE